jgi:hypothetical protein
MPHVAVRPVYVRQRSDTLDVLVLRRIGWRAEDRDGWRGRTWQHRYTARLEAHVHSQLASEAARETVA